MDDINFVIRVRYIKIAVFLLIPLILLTLNIVQYYYPHCSACTSCGTNDTQKITAAATEIKPFEVEEPVVNETPEEVVEVVVENTTETNTTEETEVDEDLLPITGNIAFTIDDVIYEDKGEWAKVTKIKYTIKNQKEDLVPKVLVYGYDDTYNTMDKDYVEETIILPELKAGKSVTKESKISITFSNLDEEKTIKLELLRDGGTTVLKTAIKKLTIS